MAPTVQLGRITALRLRGPKSSTTYSHVKIERLNDSHIGASRRHGGELLAGERTGDALDPGIHLGQVDPDIAAKNRAGQAGGTGLVGIGHGGVGVLLELDRVGPAVLDR